MEKKEQKKKTLTQTDESSTTGVNIAKGNELCILTDIIIFFPLTIHNLGPHIPDGIYRFHIGEEVTAPRYDYYSYCHWASYVYICLQHFSKKKKKKKEFREVECGICSQVPWRPEFQKIKT